MTQVALKSEGFLAKRRVAWAGGAALLGCVACCAVPLLALATGGTLLTAVSALIKPGAELFVGGAAFLATLGYAALRARNPGPAVTTGCGCSPSANGATPLYRSPDVAEG